MAAGDRLTPAQAEEAAWRRVLDAHERLTRALAEHQQTVDRLLRDSAARAVEDAELVRNFRALLPFAARRRRPPPPQIPQQRRHAP